MPAIPISQSLRDNILGSGGEAGRRWLEALPGEVEEALGAWRLEFRQAHAEQSFSFVAYARDASGADVVLKLRPPFDGADREARCLELYAGRGAARLLKADAARGWLLMERLEVSDLNSVTGEEQRVAIVARLGKELWQPAAPGHDLPHVREILSGLDQGLAPGVLDGRPELRPLFRKARELEDGLLRESRDCLLHGDLHHGNILKRGDGWAVIDPKGVVGDSLYDLGAYLLNPLGEVLKPGWEALTRRRLELFADALGRDKAVIAQWAFVVSVLRARWSWDMGYDEWANAKARAELFLTSSK